MIFPSIEEYKDALRIAGHSLKTLHDYEPVLRDDGDLWFSSGNFAVVFKVRHRTTGRLLALKCFTRHQENRAGSYRLITECLKDYPGDYLVRYEYHDEELWVNSRAAGERDFPVLAMDWAEGVTLGEYVRTCCARDDRAALEKLIAEFNWFAFWLLSQPFAHGDLKPDNIVVRPDGKPVLLDYDGLYVPAMKGQKARELGSPVYRHPARTVDAFDKRIDDFALLVLLLELRLLAAAPAKHAGRGGGESLYFRADELRAQDWRTGLPEVHASRHLLRCFDGVLDGGTVDLGALLFAMLRGDTLPALPVAAPVNNEAKGITSFLRRRVHMLTNVAEAHAAIQARSAIYRLGVTLNPDNFKEGEEYEATLVRFITVGPDTERLIERLYGATVVCFITHPSRTNPTGFSVVAEVETSDAQRVIVCPPQGGEFLIDIGEVLVFTATNISRDEQPVLLAIASA